MECQEMVVQLNDAYKAYNDSIHLEKPYVIHRCRQHYLDLMDKATGHFELIALDSQKHYEQFLGTQPTISALLKRKEEAITNADYETAASLRDQERKYLQLMIARQGLNNEDYFFCNEGKIFYKRW